MQYKNPWDKTKNTWNRSKCKRDKICCKHYSRCSSERLMATGSDEWIEPKNTDLCFVSPPVINKPKYTKVDFNSPYSVVIRRSK